MKRKTYHHGDLKNALIRAGIEILAREGAGGLTLRKVARRAGVSHSAPYAHFADKQALIAAISTEGYRALTERVEAAAAPHSADPQRQLLEAAWAYLQFAQDDPARFRISLSGVVEREKDYPALVQASQEGYAVVLRIVEACQARGLLSGAPVEAVAASVWSLVHGLASLLLEGQLPHNLVDRMSLRGLLIFALNRLDGIHIPPETA